MATGEVLPVSFYRRSAEIVASELLGQRLVRRVGGHKLEARIVETEAYLGSRDRASHAWNDRRTQRTAALFRDGGAAYVYLIYGLHCMLNTVTGSREDGTAVLVRAAEPVAGEERMARLRGLEGAVPSGQIAGGPGRLCQALAIDLRLNRTSLQRGPLIVREDDSIAAGDIVRTPRVGIDYAGDAASWPLRFSVAENPHVSRPSPTAGSRAVRGRRRARRPSG